MAILITKKSFEDSSCYYNGPLWTYVVPVDEHYKPVMHLVSCKDYLLDAYMGVCGSYNEETSEFKVSKEQGVFVITFKDKKHVEQAQKHLQSAYGFWINPVEKELHWKRSVSTIELSEEGHPYILVTCSKKWMANNFSWSFFLSITRACLSPTGKTLQETIQNCIQAFSGSEAGGRGHNLGQWAGFVLKHIREIVNKKYDYPHAILAFDGYSIQKQMPHGAGGAHSILGILLYWRKGKSLEDVYKDAQVGYTIRVGTRYGVLNHLIELLEKEHEEKKAA